MGRKSTYPHVSREAHFDAQPAGLCCVCLYGLPSAIAFQAIVPLWIGPVARPRLRRLMQAGREGEGAGGLMRARGKVTGIQRPRRPPTHRRPAALVRPSRCDRSAWCSPRLQTSHAARQLPSRSAPLRAAPRLYAQRWARPCRARNNGQKLRPCYSSGPPAPLQSAPTIPQSRPCGPADLHAQPECHRMAKN